MLNAIESVSEIAEAILQGAPEIQILATSREPLRATGEWVGAVTAVYWAADSGTLGSTRRMCHPSASRR
jgi:predicted ATPase